MVDKTTEEPKLGEISRKRPDLNTLVLCYRILLCQIKERIDYNSLVVFCFSVLNHCLLAVFNELSCSAWYLSLVATVGSWHLSGCTIGLMFLLCKGWNRPLHRSCKLCWVFAWIKVQPKTDECSQESAQLYHLILEALLKVYPCPHDIFTSLYFCWHG